MSDLPPSKDEILEAAGGGVEGIGIHIEKEEILLDINLAKHQDLVGDSVPEESSRMKSELDGINDSWDTLPTQKRSAGRIESPKGKLSKRKRKNRRRREKKATVGEGGSPPLDGNTTGNESEFSQLSEDISRDGGESGAGTDVENLGESEQDSFYSVKSQNAEVPSLNQTVIPEETEEVSEFEEAAAPEKKSQSEEHLKVLDPSSSGPTHSVDTLLKIAKCRVMSGIMTPAADIEELMAKEQMKNNEDISNQNSGDKDMAFLVPPCFPSSAPNLSAMETSADSVASSSSAACHATKQKSSTKVVHFDERPPEVVTVEAVASEERIFELQFYDNSQTVPEKPADQNESKDHSKETIILVESVGQKDSVTSSVASMESAGSLLKGTGSSCEELVDSCTESFHYPSRETVDENSNVPNEGSSLNLDSFRESISYFKSQNPNETQFIGNEVESILIKSLDKYAQLMKRAEGSQETPISRSNGVLASQASDEKEPQEVFYLDIDSTKLDKEEDLVESSASQQHTSEPELPECDCSVKEVFVDDVGQKGGVTSGPSMADSSPKSFHYPIRGTLDENGNIPNEASSLNPDSFQESSSDTYIQLMKNAEGSQETPAPDSSDSRVQESQFSERREPHEVFYLEIDSTKLDQEEAESSRPTSQEHTSEPECELEDHSVKEVFVDERSTRPKKSVEIFTLHFPTTSTAEGGDQPHSLSSPINNNSAAFLHLSNSQAPVTFEEITSSGHSSPQSELEKKEHAYFMEPETESDCPWLPERVESLTKVIAEKEKRARASRAAFSDDNANASRPGTSSRKVSVDKKWTARRGNSSNTNGRDDAEEVEGCNCAKMCIIM